MRIIRAITFLLLCLCNPAVAQQLRNPEMERMLRENPLRAGVNTYVYDFPEIVDSPAPKGYKPFYISHYGRHGARSDWGAPQYAHLIEILTSAKDAGLLSASGDSLLAEARLVQSFHNGMNGRLTARGAREHERLAERMYRRYKRVFTKGPRRIRSFSSISPRCIVSMGAFTSSLSRIDPKLEMTWDTGETYMPYLSSDCTRETRRKALQMLSEMVAAYIPDTVQVMQRLFTDPLAARKYVGDIEQFQKDIFATARVAGSFDIDRNIFRYLPFDAIYKWFEYYNLELYLCQCNSVEFGADRLPLVAPLLKDIAGKAEENIASGTVAADLRFGHDYQVLALASYLGFEGVGERMTMEEARTRWFGWLHTPFATNIQMIFYRNKAGDVLVKFLFNEREIRLIGGPSPVDGPYYRWEEIRNILLGS